MLRPEVGPSIRKGLAGLPASPGRASGPVRVIRTPEEFDRLQPGDVLVAPATTPAWTPLFARAAAVVTDTGSPLAHASLAAREYGIPAVVGTGNATARLQDGQIVTGRREYRTGGGAAMTASHKPGSHGSRPSNGAFSRKLSLPLRRSSLLTTWVSWRGSTLAQPIWSPLHATAPSASVVPACCWPLCAVWD